MEHPDSEDGADRNVAGASADNPAALPVRPSAIERQMAAASRIGYGNQAHRQTAGSENARRESYYFYGRRRRRRFGLLSVLVFFLLVAAGAAFVFIGFGRPLQNNNGAAVQSAGQTATAPKAPPASALQTAAPKKAPEVADPHSLSVPVADVSLRNRPELLEQLVQVYRSQLANDPADSAALAALNRLRQQSLSELETVIAAKDEPAAVKSLEMVSRLFPELTDNPRYQSLIAGRGQVQREAQREISAAPPAEPQPPTPAVSSPPVSQAKNISTPAASSAEAVRRPAANISSSKPQIRVASITPGRMVEQRFVPGEEGTAFMVEISYRNFKNSDDQSEGTLVALLGTPGDPTVLAEVSVDISGDRGTKSFLMETLIPGNSGEKYRLNFMLNGEFLASATVRLSVPRQ